MSMWFCLLLELSSKEVGNFNTEIPFPIKQENTWKEGGMGKGDGRRQVRGRKKGKATTRRHTEADMFQKAQRPPYQNPPHRSSLVSWSPFVKLQLFFPASAHMYGLGESKQSEKNLSMWLLWVPCPFWNLTDPMEALGLWSPWLCLFWSTLKCNGEPRRWHYQFVVETLPTSLYSAFEPLI